jgi:hypothetical protein
MSLGPRRDQFHGRCHGKALVGVAVARPSPGSQGRKPSFPKALPSGEMAGFFGGVRTCHIFPNLRSYSCFVVCNDRAIFLVFSFHALDEGIESLLRLVTNAQYGRYISTTEVSQELHFRYASYHLSCPSVLRKYRTLTIARLYSLSSQASRSHPILSQVYV